MRSGRRGGKRVRAWQGTGAESVRKSLYAVQRGICPGCGIYLPHYLRFEVDHIVALADDGKDGGAEPAAAVRLLQPGEGDEGKGDGHRHR